MTNARTSTDTSAITTSTSSLPPFISGRELCRLYYEEAVRPILDSDFPGLRYDAAQLDAGSDTLGFDTPESMDHHWGPKLQLFVSEGDHARWEEAIEATLARKLPHRFRGFPTSFQPGRGYGVMVFKHTDSGPVDHWVGVWTARCFFSQGWNIGVDPFGDIENTHWKGLCQTALRRLTTGPVYHSGLGQLETIRAKLAFYPDALWLELMAEKWDAISREEECPSRCGLLGDQVGSCLAAARIVQKLIELCFLIERQYAPYAKWLLPAFQKLNCGPALLTYAMQALEANDWIVREAAINALFMQVVTMHNALRLTEPVDSSPVSHPSRPFTLPYAWRVSEALRKQ